MREPKMNPGVRKIRRRAQQKARRAANPEISRKARREWVAIHPGQVMLADARLRARQRKVPFDLVVADIIIPDRCPIDGLPIYRNSGSLSPRSPTLDCKVPKLGYVRGNIEVISHHWNTRKRDMTADDLRSLVRYIEGHEDFPVHSTLSFGG